MSAPGLALLLALRAAAPAAAEAAPTCHHQRVRAVDPAGQTRLVMEPPTAYDWQRSAYRHEREVFDLLDHVPAPPRYQGWHLEGPECDYDDSTCAAEGRVLTCNRSPLCPPAFERYPLGGTRLVKRERQVGALAEGLAQDDRPLPVNVRRAWPHLLEAHGQAVRAVRFPQLPMGSVASADGKTLDCRYLHLRLAAQDERESLARLLAGALEPLYTQAFEGVTLPPTDDLEVKVTTGSAPLRVETGELFDSNRRTFNDTYQGYRQSAQGRPGRVTLCADDSRYPPGCRLGAWPGGKLPVRLTLGDGAWAPQQWSVGEPEHLPKPYAGYRAYRISTGLAPDWEVHLLARDVQAPSCSGQATIDENYLVHVTVGAGDDWQMGTVAASVTGVHQSDGLLATPARAEGAQASFELQATRLADRPVPVPVYLECVDAAGNRKSATIQAVPRDSRDPCAAVGRWEIHYVGAKWNDCRDEPEGSEFISVQPEVAARGGTLRDQRDSTVTFDASTCQLRWSYLNACNARQNDVAALRDGSEQSYTSYCLDRGQCRPYTSRVQIRRVSQVPDPPQEPQARAQPDAGSAPACSDQTGCLDLRYQASGEYTYVYLRNRCNALVSAEAQKNDEHYQYAPQGTFGLPLQPGQEDHLLVHRGTGFRVVGVPAGVSRACIVSLIEGRPWSDPASH